MTPRYVLHPEALNDLASIWEFIAANNIDAADRAREKIYNTIRFLAENPHTGHVRRDLASRSLRFRRVYSYLIAYAPDENPLLVLAVIHGSRSPRVMAAMLRGRQNA
jgi:plasmid stabilization system protein ParE